MLPNITTLIGASFIPMVLGFVWFHPKLFGGETWYDLAKLHGSDRSDVSTIKLLSTMILNFIIAFGFYNLVIHQFSIFSVVGGEMDLLKTGTAKAFLDEYGNTFQSFGHGFFHGIIGTFLFVVPILGYVCIFEKKSFKYFLVYLGYWLISLSIMGGILGQWGATHV